MDCASRCSLHFGAEEKQFHPKKYTGVRIKRERELTAEDIECIRWCTANTTHTKSTFSPVSSNPCSEIDKIDSSIDSAWISQKPLRLQRDEVWHLCNGYQVWVLWPMPLWSAIRDADVWDSLSYLLWDVTEPRLWGGFKLTHKRRKVLSRWALLKPLSHLFALCLSIITEEGSGLLCDSRSADNIIFMCSMCYDCFALRGIRIKVVEELHDWRVSGSRISLSCQDARK